MKSEIRELKRSDGRDGVSGIRKGAGKLKHKNLNLFVTS